MKHYIGKNLETQEVGLCVVLDVYISPNSEQVVYEVKALDEIIPHYFHESVLNVYP